ncbi:unnamed protein product [Albugo candida]|uniref:Uncharacterized protein n=1 Tax=Albugo candida TaxID=65357 RepID=A0A024GDT8_9STRA|nr:unnamed protein product [Albugo candida]|eukprot:CCI44495.1 unnamed protein product [Albugo candida]
MPIGTEKRINDEYGNASNHSERALLDYVLAIIATETRDPVQVRTRATAHQQHQQHLQQ